MKLTTTLDEIKKHDPCADEWAKLLEYLGDDYPADKEINLLIILDSNGVSDCLWALRATLQDSKRISVRLAVEFAASVLRIFEAQYQNDKRPRKVIEAAREWIANPTEENRGKVKIAAAAAYAAAYAAYAAAYAAKAAAAADAAYAAAYAAAAAAKAAYAAAYAAERRKQKAIIKSILSE